MFISVHNVFNTHLTVIIVVGAVYTVFLEVFHGYVDHVVRNSRFFKLIIWIFFCDFLCYVITDKKIESERYQR